MKSAGSLMKTKMCRLLFNTNRTLPLNGKNQHSVLLRFKHTIYILAVSALFILNGCNEKWNEHYNNSGETKIASPLNLLEYLQSKPEYSRFVKMLDSTGVAVELTRDQNLTIWAVNNEAMAELENMTMFTDTFVMQYHVNNLALGANKLYDGQRIPSLGGKYIPMSFSTDGIYAGDSKIMVADQFCKNGVVHEVDRLMIPRVSIYEYLLNLGDDFSMITDSIFSANDTVFDEANSKPIGVDSEGNTIYDSAYVIENPLFDIVDFRSEFSQTTLFLPSNEVINSCYGKLYNQLTAIGKPCTYKDTLMAFNWIKAALFYNGTISNYGDKLDYTSVENKIWRSTVQQVNTTPHKMSNGLIYESTLVKIPNNIYLPRLKGLCHYYEYVPDSVRSSLIQFINCTTYQPKTADSYNFASTGGPTGNYKVLDAAGASPSDTLKLAVEFSPLKIATQPDNTILATEMLIPAGEYRLYMGFQEKNHAYVNIYFNGQLLSANLAPTPATPWNYDRTDLITGKSRIWDGTGGLVGLVNVPGTDMEHVKIKVEFNLLRGQTSEKLDIYHWLLMPTANNY